MSNPTPPVRSMHHFLHIPNGFDTRSWMGRSSVRRSRDLIGPGETEDRGTRGTLVEPDSHRFQNRTTESSSIDRSIDRPVEARVRHPSRSYAGLFPMPVSNAVKGQYTNGSWTITVEDEVGPSAPRCHCLMPIRALGANEDALERMAE